ncbi:MAG: Fe-S-containing hydro-lyase [Deltaproteobacteria bacterium]|nr:Fe-S-containing hydro-lyase [Deltaproteobacteria bacterium]
MQNAKWIKTPLQDKVIENLRVGDKVFLSGRIFTARDAAHKRFMEILDRAGELPIKLSGEVIYYCGPTPSPPGKIIGACGPTTSSRMDSYTPRLLSMGLKGMIGKGKRSETVQKAIVENKAVYFAALGGAGALLSKFVVSSQIVAFEDLGPEAIFMLEVREMPLFVANDIYGGDLYVSGIEKYKIL